MKGKHMKLLLATTLFAVATLSHAQSIEADLDGNASALQASEMRARPAARVAAQPKTKKAERQRVAAR